MLDRTRARRQALQLLYQREITGVCFGSDGKKRFIDAETNVDGEIVASIESLEDYAYRLVQGVTEKNDILDDKIEEVSENWSLVRMPLVDRSILRLACYEMYYIDEVPVSVSINEAIELARIYGGEDDSYRFINGVLGKVARTLDETDEKSDSDTIAQMADGVSEQLQGDEQ